MLVARGKELYQKYQARKAAGDAKAGDEKKTTPPESSE